MSRISFTVTESERAEIAQYVKAKKRWRDPAALARDAVFQLMGRYPASRKNEEAKSTISTIIHGTFVGGTAQGLVGQNRKTSEI